MELAPNRAGELGEPALDRHVDVLVGVRERKYVVVQLPFNLIEPLQELIALRVGDDPLRRKHGGVRARLGDVVRGEAPIERDRIIERAEVGMLGIDEARHGGGW